MRGHVKQGADRGSREWQLLFQASIQPAYWHKNHILKKSIVDHNPNKMSIPPPVTPSPLSEWITLNPLLCKPRKRALSKCAWCIHQTLNPKTQREKTNPSKWCLRDVPGCKPTDCMFKAVFRGLQTCLTYIKQQTTTGDWLTCPGDKRWRCCRIFKTCNSGGNFTVL